MAKANLCTSLCVCEGKGSTTEWRRIADMNKMGESEFFYRTPRGIKPEFIPCKQGTDNIADVKVIDWQMTDGKISGTMNSRVQVIEIADLRAFHSVYLEDEETIRNLLLKGVCIPNILARPFMNGTTSLAFVIKSKDGRKYGLLLTDKGKVVINDTDQGGLIGGGILHIAETPSDAQRSMHTLPIVDLENTETIEYEMPLGNGLKRQFLALPPERTGQLYLYPISKYIPIYLKRQLNRSKATIQLSSGRSLTGKDISAIMDAVSEALKDKEEFGELMQISEAASTEEISSGVAAYMKSLREDLTQNSDLSGKIRDFMWADEKIRHECMTYGKSAWLETHGNEIKAAEADLERIQKAVGVEEASRQKAEACKKELLAECEEARKALSDICQQQNNAKQAFRENVQRYRTDLAGLAAAYGLGTGSFPMVSSAQPVVPCSMAQNGKFEDAFSSNLANFLSRKTADMVSKFVEQALDRSMHLAVNGAFASIFAIALSAAIDGTEPAVITRTDDTCSAAELIQVIESQPGHVVLLEGVFGCAADIYTLAVSRRIQDKTIVFSMDDLYGTENMTKTLFLYTAILKDLVQEGSTPELCHWEQADAPSFRARRLGYEPFPEAGCAQKLAEYQNNLVQGEATL